MCVSQTEICSFIFEVHNQCMKFEMCAVLYSVLCGPTQIALWAAFSIYVLDGSIIFRIDNSNNDWFTLFVSARTKSQPNTHTHSIDMQIVIELIFICICNSLMGHKYNQSIYLIRWKLEWITEHKAKTLAISIAKKDNEHLKWSKAVALRWIFCCGQMPELRWVYRNNNNYLFQLPTTYFK